MTRLRDALMVGAVVSVLAGVALIYIPAALIVAGVGAITVAVVRRWY